MALCPGAVYTGGARRHAHKHPRRNPWRNRVRGGRSARRGIASVAARHHPQCTICKHREVAALELAIARGISVQALSKRYKCSSDALYRHRDKHMPPQLKARLLAGPDLAGVDLDKLRETESQSLLAHLIALRHRLFAMLDFAEEHGDMYAADRAVQRLHTNLETTGKLLGDLGVGHTTVTNILVQPAYVELRVALTNALAPFPQARAAVAAVLAKVEGAAAAAISADKRVLAHGPAERPTLIAADMDGGRVIEVSTGNGSAAPREADSAGAR